MLEKILVADDETLMLQFIAKTLSRKGYAVTTASDGEEAIAKMLQEPFDCIISDVMMPKKNGLDVLRAAKAKWPQTLVILATAHGSIETAVEAMRLGAFNYLLKPFSPEALEAALEKAQDYLRLQEENVFLREERKHIKCPELIAASPAMKKIMHDLERIAKSQASVFITGESGTGKEVIAAAIHQMSARFEAPFIKVNCAAIAESLVESEFFGHEKGAFTGAHTKKAGRFELADRGTLLLDEVTEIPFGLQAKLLRAIQEQEFERVGATRSIKVNVRFLATSNRNMLEAVQSKVFREDLYYRLNVVPIHIPPLRTRREDIIPLAESFLRRYSAENHKSEKKFTQKAIERLLCYSWPGNVRELANIIERCVVLDFDREIDVEHLYLEERAPPLPRFSPGMTLHEMEKRLILDTLEKQAQNRAKTASILGISIRTLRNKLQEYSLNSDD